MPLRRDGADLLVAIRLSPKATIARIAGTFTDSAGQRWMQASVTAPPDKGKANAALISLIAKRFKHPQSTILLETGDTNRLKRLRICGAGPDIEQSLQEIAAEERNEK